MPRPVRARLLATARLLALAAPLALVGRPGAAQTRYFQRNLVSDIPGLAQHTDADLVNPWGISSSASGPFWVSDAAKGLSTIYNSLGVKNTGLIVTIPVPGGGTSEPTGQVFNNTGSLVLSNGNNATFLFATTQGTIAGWNGAAGTTAITMVDNGGGGASYTGLAIGGSAGDARLYAANFAQGKIDSFDNTFGGILAGAFTDPNLPAGYSPFNIQNVGGTLYVAYAQFDPGTGEEVAGPGLGVVDAYDLDGMLVRRVVGPGGALDAPWGFALAPGGFGTYAGSLLVGNFGDGTINAYDPLSGAFRGTLLDQNGVPIENDGLWGLRFGNGGNGGALNTLYLSAGLDDETHGLFASLAPMPEPGTLVLEATGLGLVLGAVRSRRRRG